MYSKCTVTEWLQGRPKCRTQKQRYGEVQLLIIQCWGLWVKWSVTGWRGAGIAGRQGGRRDVIRCGRYNDLATSGSKAEGKTLPG